MILINGILCLAAAAALLYQIKSLNDQEPNQWFYKFVWLYWALLMLMAITHLFSTLVDPDLKKVLTGLGTVTDTLNAVGGIILSVYLSHRRQLKSKIR